MNVWLLILLFAGILASSVWAYQSFWVQSGGNDTYAGTSSTNTLVWSNASTSWTGGATNTIAVTDAAASAVAVNDWINVGGGWVAQVTNVNATGAPAYVFTLSNTGYGVKPATNAAIAVADGGAWADLLCPVLTGSGTVTTSVAVNVKSSSTTTLTGSTTLGLKGATTTPIIYRGYNTTLGDLDNGSTALAYPIVGNSSFGINLAGTFSTYNGFSFTGTPASALVTVSLASTVLTLRHCDLNNTGSSSAAAAFNMNAGGVFVRTIQCNFQTPATSAQIFAMSNGTTLMAGSYLSGAGSGSIQMGISQTGGTLMLLHSTIASPGAQGIVNSGVSLQVDFCTFQSCGADAIKLTGVSSNTAVLNSAFFKSGGSNINNASGTNSAAPVFMNNLSYAPTSGHLSGFGDLYEWGGASLAAGVAAFVDTNDPRVSATDFHLLATSLGAGAGIPGQWEGRTAGLTSTPDVGAWQRAVGGTSLIVNTGMNGGFSDA